MQPTHLYLMLFITFDLLLLCLARAALAWLTLLEIDRLLSHLET
jgi:hypothetical protein